MSIKRKHNRVATKRSERRAERKARELGLQRPPNSQLWRTHPLFGRIPCIDYVPDRDFQPPLPPGAVRGNPRQQNIGWLNTPHYFYVDQERLCRDCGQPFGFSAEEQRYWYEELKFFLDSVPVCCLPCRRNRRSGGGISAALAAVRERPEDADAWITVARATLDLVRRQGRGKLEQAIAATRTALRLDPTRIDALYWEAACHETAGRTTKAAASYRQFLAAAQRRPRLAELIQRAGERLAALSITEPPAPSGAGAATAERS